MLRAALLPALVALALVAPLFAAAPVRDPHGKRFGGETCVACHVAAPLPAPSAPSEMYDVVIVGGGMAGLSTLHYAAQNGRRALLLEVEREAGGQMRADSWKGITYAKGAAYFVEPYGILREFYESEKIPFVKIHEPENSAFIGHRFFPNCWTEGKGRMPWPAAELAAWNKYFHEMDEVNTNNKSNQPFDSFDPDQRKLDSITAYEDLKRHGLSEEMIAHLDRYIPSCFGEGSRVISASAFANYISGELGGNFTVPGGMGGVTRIIAANHARDIRLGCRVTNISQTMTQATVTYLDPDNRPHTVAGRTVVAAVPCNLLPELIPDLPREKVDVIRHTKYSSYLVAAVLCDQVLWDDRGYDTWIDGTYFKDIIDATWIARDGKPYANKHRPHVLSLYCPLGVHGLDPMMNWTPKQFEQAILKDLEKTIPGARRHVSGIRLYRWGHSMHVAEPGFLTKSVPILRKPYFRIFFAGAEVEGLPCNESAIWSGYGAARGIETFLWDKVPALR